MAEWFAAARRRWAIAYGRGHYPGEGRALVMPLVVAVTLGLVLGLGLARHWIPEQSRAASETNRAQLAEAMDRSPAAHTAGEDPNASPSVRLDRCEEVYTAQVRPLTAVGPAMTQWEVHIGAMNKLVIGAITLAQARAFWNQTREGAARNLAEFGHAQRAYAQRTARCPMPLGRASDELRGCAAVVAARHRELRRATAALGTWRTHVKHMEMLRHGEMSPEDATQMWLKSWREGDRQVNAYRSAARGTQRVAGSPQHHQDGTEGRCTGKAASSAEGADPSGQGHNH
jgi:hypothetical protein